MNPPTNLIATVRNCEDIELPVFGPVDLDWTPPTDYYERELLSAQVGANYTGTSTVINVIVGRGYYWTRGANETSIAYNLLEDQFLVVDDVNETQYFLPTKDTVTIVHANNAAVTATLHELRVQTYRTLRDGVVMWDGVSTKNHSEDYDSPGGTLARYEVEAIAANGDRGRSAAVFAMTQLCPPGWPITFGTTANDFPNSFRTALDGSGNLLVAGNISKGLLVLKFTSAGSLAWYKFFSNSSTIPISMGGMALKSNGNIVIGCLFNGTVNFGGSDLVSLAVQTEVGSQGNIVLFELTSAGVHQWSFMPIPASRGPVTIFGSSSIDSENVLSVTVDASGNIYVSGISSPREGLFTFDNYWWLESYDSSQVLRWNRKWTTSQSGSDIKLLMNGAQLWAFGLLSGTTATGCGDVTSTTTPTGVSSQDMFLQKVNATTGECQSMIHYGSGDTERAIFALPLDDGGLVVVIETTSLYSPPDVGGGPVTGTFFYGAFVVARYNSNGVLVWQSPYRNQSFGIPLSLALHGNNVLMTGIYSHSFVWGGVRYPNSRVTPYDGFVARLRLSDGAQLPETAITTPLHKISAVLGGAINATHFYYLYPVDVAGRGKDLRIERVAL